MGYYYSHKLLRVCVIIELVTSTEGRSLLIQTDFSVVNSFEMTFPVFSHSLKVGINFGLSNLDSRFHGNDICDPTFVTASSIELLFYKHHLFCRNKILSRIYFGICDLQTIYINTTRKLRCIEIYFVITRFFLFVY